MKIACMLRDLQKRARFDHAKERDISAYFNRFNHSFTSRFKRKLSEKSTCFEKKIVFIILNVKYLRHSKIFANKFAEVFFVVFVVFISDRCTFSWLSRSLWTQRIYEQIIEITYSVDRWEKKKQWVDRFEAKLRKNEE